MKLIRLRGKQSTNKNKQDRDMIELYSIKKELQNCITKYANTECTLRIIKLSLRLYIAYIYGLKLHTYKTVSNIGCRDVKYYI